LFESVFISEFLFDDPFSENRLELNLRYSGENSTFELIIF